MHGKMYGNRLTAVMFKCVCVLWWFKIWFCSIKNESTIKQKKNNNNNKTKVRGVNKPNLFLLSFAWDDHQLCSRLQLIYNKNFNMKLFCNCVT